ncbi:hypothetical protein HDV00_011108 [Rhizophlyctis rosea]|nr:hypothetical protein HDV00_011108 [Rhizophlyctis rosea]
MSPSSPRGSLGRGSGDVHAGKQSTDQNNAGPYVIVQNIGSGDDKKSIKSVKTGTINRRPTVTPPADENMYTVNFPVAHELYHKKSNYIRTTKYTLLTFLPLNLYQQFGRFYNIYFLIGALLVLTKVSGLSPVTQIFPLVVVLAFAAAKEAIEDYSRYKSDRTANNVPCTVIRGGQKQEILSMNIQPGDIMYLEKGDKAPVDAMIIATSYEDGTCFVETAELDGETNLKRRSAVSELAGFQSDQAVSSMSGSIRCEQPNERLTSFEGRVHVGSTQHHPDHSGGKPEHVHPLSMTNLILRGAVLRNTDYAYVLVVYTGSNTKIIKNLKKGKPKRSTMERRLNWLVAGAFGFNALILISSILLEWVHYIKIYNQEQERRITNPNDFAVEWYLGIADTNKSKHVLYSFISFFVLYTYVIPISLFVTMEVVRLVQAQYMMWDKKMRVTVERMDGTIEKRKMRANNSNLNEDLGAVEYIFSDKTGTLTQNDMRLHSWWVGREILEEMKEPGILRRKLERGEMDEKTRWDFTLFGRTMALCHGVIPSVNETTGQMIYESQSPDESALLYAISNDGFVLKRRLKNKIEIEVMEKVEQYELLTLLDFTSDRKRMSAIVRTPEGKIHLYCKGADNIILGRLSKDEEKNPAEFISAANQALQTFAEEGLRTLCVAWRELGEEEYEAFKEEYDEAERTVGEREKRVAEACEVVEREMTLLGCTAIEDRLQDEVPETIEYLLKCDIRLWLLTGDKRETAIEIGHSSNLIEHDMNVLILETGNEKDCGVKMDNILRDISNDHRRHCLVVNGEALAHVFTGSPDHQRKFLNIGMACHSVICCRVTPLQKALVVKLVKNNLKCVTLAIGDGANDVSMIQAADIGVGIAGREGTQAVRASDYAFAEFRFLRRLLTVHGRYSYQRMSGLIFYSFYKNFTFIMVQWWFGFLSAWSGQTVYEEIFLTLFNVVFTSLPPLFYAMFERDIPDDLIAKHPQAYIQIARGQYWNYWTILTTLVSSLWHSLAIFGAVYFVHREGQADVNGRSTGYWVQCYLFSTPLLITVLLRHGLGTGYWNWIVWVALLGSALLNLAEMGVVEGLMKTVESGTFEINHALPAYWMLILLMPVFCCLPDFALM